MSRYFFISFFILTRVSFANYIDDKVSYLNWNGVPVVYLEDESYPTFDLAVYFEGGAFFDEQEKAGQAQVMFDLLTSGTSKYSQAQISEHFEYYGARQQAQVTHEYSSYNVSGLVENATPTIKMVCHLFQDARFPEQELARHTERLRTALRNLSSNHSALANTIFRQLSFEGTGYERPVEGTLKSLDKIKVADLKEKLSQFNNDITKRVYIRGPKSVLGIRDIFKQDCQWKKNQSKQSQTKYRLPEVKEKLSKDTNAKLVHLITVPSANQTQIRIGKVLPKSLAHQDYELTQLATQFLGGGFTSELMQAVRVRKGLTYSIRSYMSPQENYARAGINTFTKNETIVETLKTIDEVVKKSSENISDERLAMIKRYSKGAYLFGLESASDFLSNLIYFDHIGRPYSAIYKFPERVDSVKSEDLNQKVLEVFNPESQMIVLVGDASIKKNLEKAGYEVKLMSYEDFL